VHHTLPLALPKDDPKPAKLIGWNLPPDLPLAKAQLAGPPPVSDLPEVLELEPHTAPQPLELPCAVTGHIGRPAEEDRYTFTAAKQKIYELKVTAAALGSPLDGWLKIESAAGKELARNDDAGVTRDPQLTWTAPADGPVTVVVGDMTHHGGSDYFYRLAIREAVPGVETTIASSAFTVAAGKTVDLKVQCKRLHKFAKPLEVIAKNLPEGVTAAPAKAPDKDGEVTLKLTASADAKPANQPFQLALREPEGGAEYQVRNLLTATAENNGVPNGYSTLLLPAIADLWLTVTGK
jgi:hypothetical protein